LKPPAGATLIELFLVVAFVGVGIAVSNTAGKSYGLLGYAGGLIAGTIGACCVFFALGFCFAFTFELLTGRPTYPICSNGKCRYGESSESDYRLEDSSGQLIARCRCGIGYVKKGRRVAQIHADGTQSPYMIWKPLRGWFRDEAHG
jgi:hypothetical protein